MPYFLDNNDKIAISPIPDQFNSFSFYLKDAKKFSNRTFLFENVDNICKNGITSTFEGTSFRIRINRSKLGSNKISLFNGENIESTINIKTEKLKENILRIQQSGINDHAEDMANFDDYFLIRTTNPAIITNPSFHFPHFNHVRYAERIYGTPPGSPPRGGQGL